MINLASVLEVSDFTEKELEVVKQHIETNNNISFENMVDAWRDNDGFLCISYEYESASDSENTISNWWHYDSSKQVWW